MKPLIIFSFLLCALLGTAQSDTVSEAQSTAPSFWSTSLDALQWRGYFLSDNRLNTYKGNNAYDWQEHRLALLPEFKTGRTRFAAELWVRSFRFPEVNNYMGLTQKNNINPLDIDLREAYFDVYDFLIPRLDLRIGRQRHAWGAADRLNPTDNLNPYDLEDMWDFGRHLASNSIKLTYYLSDFTISAIYIPTFTPLQAPDSATMTAFMPEVNLPTSINNNNNLLYLNYKSINDSLFLPDRHLSNSIFGFRVEKPFGAFNTSLSYMMGYDALPAPQKTEIKPLLLNNDTLTIDLFTQLYFSKTQVIGFDIAGSILNMGIWAEAALFIPEKVVNNTTMSMMGIMIMNEDSVVIDGKPYLKYIIGTDYTFTNGTYLNFQYLHGFFHERRNELGNYFIIALNIPMFRNKVTFAPINSSVQIKDFGDIKNNYGLVVMPEITYSGIDNASFSIGTRFIEGTDNTLFGKMKNKKDVFVKLRYTF